MNANRPDREDLDRLYARVASGDATADEWSVIVASGKTDPDVWRDLAYALRDELDLAALARAAEGASDDVMLPGHEPVLARIDDEDARAPRRHEASPAVRLPTWLGWAAAALLFLALILNSVQAPRTIAPSNGEPQVAGVGLSGLSTDEAFRTAYEKGREDGSVLSEEPRKVILQTREIASDQGFEIIFIEQVVRKTTVPTLYRVQGVDERGRPSMVQFRPARGNAL